MSLLLVLHLASCASAPKNAPKVTAGADGGNGALTPAAADSGTDGSAAVQPPQPEPQTLTLLFAGDIMAHKNNYSYPDFAAIWEDVTPLVSSADLAFANVEAPVADSLEWSTYPQFNMHSSYVEAAIGAGFDVFSLANNHTNDKSLAGMQETRRWFARRAGIWACGIKEKANAPLTYQLVEKDGWKLLFVAFTQVLNSWDSVAYIDYVQSTEEKQAALIATLTELKKAHEPDLLIVSVHADEVEYKRTVWQNQKDFYRRLVSECGADIVWSNHAHVVKPWEHIAPGETAPHGALIMYANGNTISGQRTNPQFAAPDTERDWTGDGLMMTVTFTKTTSAAGVNSATAAADVQSVRNSSTIKANASVSDAVAETASAQSTHGDSATAAADAEGTHDGAAAAQGARGNGTTAASARSTHGDSATAPADVQGTRGGTTAADDDATTSASTISLTGYEPHFITTILAANGQPVIRLLDDDLVRSMRRAGRPAWSDYLAARKRLMESMEEIR